MKVTGTLKTLTLVGLTAMTLSSGFAQADDGYWGGYQPSNNPWLNNPPPARHQGDLRERIAQLDKRQDSQMQRILAGMENGQLNMREATALLREHLAISNMERRYLADGRLGPNELRDLEQRLDEANRHIRLERRDREQSPVVRPYDYR